MKHIPQDFIFDLVARSNIVEIIGLKVKIKKKGQNYFGCCPFHNEKTASFSVNEKKQLYYCFGCGASGSVINFLMDLERLSFLETIEELANHAGLTVPYIESTSSHSKEMSASNVRTDLYGLLGNIANFYHDKLSTPDANNAREYLEKRGLSAEIIERFNIGYSPDSWNDTHRQFANSKELLELYDQAGMLVKNDNNHQYDRFRGRVMFPIRDRRGKTIGFGGRTIKADDTVKYLNSPETPIFHKGRQLYGLYEALEIQRNPERLLVVEGYMDVIALAQFGINYAVAALGTATTTEHIQLLFRASDNVVFCYDGDNAGQRAAWRALNVLLPTMVDGKKISFVFLPEGEDPDSMIRQEGRERFEKRLDDAQTLSSFLFAELLKNVDLVTPEGKAKLSALAIPLINQVSAETFNLSLRQQLGEYLGKMDISQVDKLFSNSQKTENRPAFYQPIQMKLTTMRILIGLLLQYPELAKVISDTEAIKQSKLAGIDIFIKLLELCYRHPDITTAQLLSEFIEHPHLKQLQQLAVWDHRYDEEDITSIFTDTLKALYDSILNQRQDELIAKGRTQKMTPEEKKELMAIQLALLKKA